MIFSGFWKNLDRPIVGVAPMDGVTDAAFRHMICKYSKPSLVMTEFTNVEGLARGAIKMMSAFLYSEIERPIVAQIYGVEVDSFYKCSVMLCAMGFNGIDINMGCPANKVAKKGSGAGLIQTPELAKKIIRACKKGVGDWVNGISLEDAGIHENLISQISSIHKNPTSRIDACGLDRVEIPVSVKTRIGFDSNIASEWVKHLMEELPANISMHGRTLKQMYLGAADWDAIAEAAEICRGSDICFLGNGDVKSMDDAREKCEKYGVDGVLVGRALMGNPWFFNGKKPDSIAKRFEVLLDHCKYFEDLNYASFHNIKKHLAWYCKGFDGAKELRLMLMKADSFKDVKEIVDSNFDKINTVVLDMGR